MKKIASYSLLLISLLALSACSVNYVSPWEKGVLARPEMMFSPDPLEQRLRDHVYYAKEASASGSAVTGGGCGCN